MTLKVGHAAPGLDIAVQAYDRTKDGSDDQFLDLKLSDFAGKWVCLYFYPLDFTFVCPTEIVAFNKAMGEFEDRFRHWLEAKSGQLNCDLATAQNALVKMITELRNEFAPSRLQSPCDSRDTHNPVYLGFSKLG